MVSTTIAAPLASVPSIADSLRAVADHLASYPWRTVRDALARLSLPASGIAADLFELQGPDACETIEAEILALSWREVA